MKIFSLFPSGPRCARRGFLVFLVLLNSFLSTLVRAQAPPPLPPAPFEQNAPHQLSAEELNGLLAPIALYPDALVALILPASTVPTDLVLAARYVASNGDPAQVSNQPWDDSVKSLVRYPDVLKWMDQNLEWTTTVGEAFIAQPADVMNSIQRLRADAVAAGNLTDTPSSKSLGKTHLFASCLRNRISSTSQYDPSWSTRGPTPRILVRLWHLAWDLPSVHGSTTIAIGIAAVCMWVSGARNGNTTETGIAGAGVRIAASLMS